MTEKARFTSALTTHRQRIRNTVRYTVPHPHRSEGEHVASIGLMHAIRKSSEDATTPEFWWRHAYWIIRRELNAWLSVGVYWRKPANRSAAPARVAALGRATQARIHWPLDDHAAGLPCSRPTPEDDFASAEVQAIVRRIVAKARTPGEARTKIRKVLAR